MTSVPTWLVVLVPVLAAVVAGGLALLGIIVKNRSDAGAAARTAERNAALARQEERRHWNRERLEKPYITLLERRNQLVKIRRQYRGGLWPGRQYGWSTPVYREVARKDLDAQQSLREALVELELVGSPAAVELSRRWVEALCAPRLVENVEAKSPEYLGPALASLLTRDESTFRDPFVALIRHELGVDV